VIRGAIDLLHPLAERRGVSVQTQLSAVACTGDPDQLGQVVANLLANALHHTAAGHAVRIELARQERTIVLTVSDEGEGIAAKDLPHLFERFYRADKSRARPEGRTGLGLAISQAIVAAHGGRIEVRSEPGRGSVFTVSLPESAAT
jgi:signal transduction histidine kinase